MELAEEDPVSDCQDPLSDDSDRENSISDILYARKLLAARKRSSDNRDKYFTSAYKREIAELVSEEEQSLRQLVEEIKEHERAEIARNPWGVVERDWTTIEAIQRRVRRKLAIKEPQIAASKNVPVVIRDWPWTAEEERQPEEEEEEEEEEQLGGEREEEAESEIDSNM